MNLRFPEVFGLLLLAAFLCSFALPRPVSGRIENTFQFLFAPVTGPIQWITAGKAEPARADAPIFSGTSDELQRLRDEKRALTNYVETLRGQLETLQHRETEASRIGGELREKVTVVKVIAPDANGRDYLRLAGTSAGVIEKDQAVVSAGGLIGKVSEVGGGNQSSVRLITDRGLKLLGKFGRYVDSGNGTAQLAWLELPPILIEGAGNGTLRISSLKLADVRTAGVMKDDILLLSDEISAQWPIEVHGYRIGKVFEIGEKLDTPGVADIIVKPDVDLLTLKEVWIVTRK